ncbi:unnamed protein product, partial [Iphiclides podalirius]
MCSLLVAVRREAACYPTAREAERWRVEGGGGGGGGWCRGAPLLALAHIRRDVTAGTRTWRARTYMHRHH